MTPDPPRWDSEGNRTAFERGRRMMNDIKNAGFCIDEIEDPAERSLSWRMYALCNFNGIPWHITPDGLRPIKQPDDDEYLRNSAG